MRNKLNLVGLIMLGATTLLAQNDSRMPVTIGVIGGVQVTDMFDANNTTLFSGNQSVPGSLYNAAVPRYILGVSGEFHLPYHLRFEVDGLYKRAGFATQNIGGSVTQFYNTSFNQFEIPGVFKYNVSLGHFRPFIEAGASLRHIAGISQSSQFTDVPLFYGNNNTPELRNRNSYGGVAGFGITFKYGPMEISPEARYTRWSNEAFSAAGLRTNLDQGDVLVDFSF